MSCLFTWQSVQTVGTLIFTYIFKVCAWGGILDIYSLSRVVIIIDDSELIQLAKTHKWAHFNWIFLTFSQILFNILKEVLQHIWCVDCAVSILVLWTLSQIVFFKVFKSETYWVQVRVYHSTDIGLNISSDITNYKLLSTY